MENNREKKQGKALAIGITLIYIAVLSGIGFAFFSLNPLNTNNEKLKIGAATLSLKFEDNDNGISGNLNLGQSITKKFTIENTGTIDAYAKINWTNLVNTYTSKSLSFSLEQSESDNGTYLGLASGNVPVSNTPKSEVLKDSILVQTNKKYYYKLTITLNNLDTNQNSDINASFHSTFSLEEGKEIVPAAKQIQNLVKGANKTSTEEIQVQTNVKRYVLKFNGFILLAEDEYDDLETCQDDILGYNEDYGSNANFECRINTSTNKYNIYATGDSSSSQDEIYQNEKDCNERLRYYPNTTCEEKEIQLKSTLAYDGTSDNNLRYVGANPNNWVRIKTPSLSERGLEAKIIGVFNNVDDGTGKKETRVKVIIAGSSGTFGTFGTTNKWENSELLLNNPNYLNAKWYLRGMPSSVSSVTPSVIYDTEKTSGEVYPGNSAEWTGASAISNISDYVLAVGGENREFCLTKNIVGNSTTPSEYYNSGCSPDNWMFDGPTYWTLNQTSDINTKGFTINRYGIATSDVSGNNSVKTVIYLPADTIFTGGDGIRSNPYIVELNTEILYYKEIST